MQPCSIIVYVIVSDGSDCVVTGKGWPLNHHFIFDITAIITVFIMLLSLTLPKASEKKRLPEAPNNSVQLVDDHNTITATNGSLSMVNR